MSSKFSHPTTLKLDELLARARPDLHGAYVWSDGTVSLAPRRDVKKPTGAPPSPLAFAVCVFQRGGCTSHWFVRSCNRKEIIGGVEERKRESV